MTKLDLQNMRGLAARIGRLGRTRFDALFATDLATGVPTLPPEAAEPPAVKPRIDIPVRGVSSEGEARARHVRQGQFLARQDAWDELGPLIREADAARAATPGGRPVAALLCEGAHCDAVVAAREAIAAENPSQARAAMRALSETLAEYLDDYGIALVVARAHLSLAEAWAEAATRSKLPPACLDARDRHLEAAMAVADRYDPFACDSPMLARLRCDLLMLDRRPQMRLSDDYEDLIELDPGCPDHMRAMGRDLLPDRFGDLERLETEARRVAALVKDVWGMGGYVWVLIDALAFEPKAFRRIDREMFVEGMHDILARRPDQHMVNTLASFCGYSLSGSSQPRSARADIAGCLGWIAQNHLREIHPLPWAEALRPGNGAQLRSADSETRRGQVRALSALAEHFAPQISEGKRLVFTQTGAEFVDAH